MGEGGQPEKKCIKADLKKPLVFQPKVLSLGLFRAINLRQMTLTENHSGLTGAIATLTPPN